MPLFRHPIIATASPIVLLAGALLAHPNGFSPAQVEAIQTAGAAQAASARQDMAAPDTVPEQPPSARPSPELQALRQDIQQTINTAGWRGAQWGVIVTSLERGDTLFAVNPDLPLAPASNMKLFSTAAALYYLGPDFRYSTYLLADGDVEEGVLHGDVILYGTGDPTISARMLGSSLAPLQALADSLLAQGIREVSGDVVGDGSYFDAAYRGEGWSDSYRLASYSAPVGGLSFAENMVSVRVLPGASAGQPAEIRTVPATRGLAIRNEVRTVSSGANRVRFDHDEGGMVVSGQISRSSSGVARSMPVVDPTNYAAAAFRAVLEERGITVRGGVRTVSDPRASRVGMGATTGSDGGTPAPRVMAVHLSPTLLEIVNVTNKISQNLYAEALMKTVGRVVFGEGSAASGARAIAYMLECETDADPGTLRFADGSGLSRLNAVTPRATVQLLDFMARSGFSESFTSSLPLAAAPDDLRHSLRNRLGATPAAMNLRAKTGTISRVSSLAGYVNSAGGEPLAFVIFVNETPSTALSKRVEDAIGRRLASFDRPTRPTLFADAVSPQDPVEGGELQLAQGETGQEGDVGRASAEERSTPQTHRVRSGDTLDGISRRYGTSLRALEQANPGLDPRRLQLGQEIRIPEGG